MHLSTYKVSIYSVMQPVNCYFAVYCAHAVLSLLLMEGGQELDKGFYNVTEVVQDKARKDQGIHVHT